MMSNQEGNTMKSTFKAVLLAAGLAVLAPATAHAEATVAVNFGSGLSKFVSRIDRVESLREERFRKYYVDTRSERRSSRAALRTMVGNIDFGGEIAVPNVDDFNTRNLVQGLVEESLKRAGIDYDGTVTVEIEVLKVQNHPVAVVANGPNWIRGSITLSGDGRNETVSLDSHFVPAYTSNFSYDGPDFPFMPSDVDSRIGPSLAYFVHKGLSELFPDTEVPRAVIVQVQEF